MSQLVEFDRQTMNDTGLGREGGKHLRGKRLDRSIQSDPTRREEKRREETRREDEGTLSLRARDISIRLFSTNIVAFEEQGEINGDDVQKYLSILLLFIAGIRRVTWSAKFFATSSSSIPTGRRDLSLLSLLRISRRWGFKATEI